jgi:hypothetical protein
MKNGIKIFWVAALAAIFAITACNKSKAADGGLTAGAKAADEANAGNSIRLSNVPVTDADPSLSYDFGYTATGPGEIDPLGSFMTGKPKAEVNNGRLTLELDTPHSGLMQPLIHMFYTGNNDISVIPPDANGYTPSFQTSNVFSESTNSYRLRIKGGDQGKGENGAWLLYADKEVTMNGSNSYFNFDNIFLAKGWNYVTYTYSDETNYVKTASQTLPSGYVWAVSDEGIFKPPRNDAIVSDELYIYDYEKILSGDLSDFTGRWANNTGESRTLRADGTFADGQTAGGFTTRTMTNGGTYYMWGVHIPDEGGFGVMLFPVGTGIQFGNEFYETDKGKVRLTMGHDLPSSSDDIFYLE